MPAGGTSVPSRVSLEKGHSGGWNSSSVVVPCRSVMPFRKSLVFWTLLLGGLLVNSGDAQLIRPTNVYKDVIRGVHDYYNNTCILLLHATPDPIRTQELDKGLALLDLQLYLSSEVRVRTVIMDLQMFVDRVGTSYFHIKRPLFVLLNDQEDLKYQFAQVSTWITMAYPTWLLFMRNETEIDDFLSEIYIPFDCVFLITTEDDWRKGEIIKDVYRIHREDELRSMAFGSWTPGGGFRAPTRGLYQRRADLNGLQIRVVAIEDPPVAVIKRDENDLVYLDGFFGKVLELLGEKMNCSFEIIEASSWGTQLSNGTWTGAIRQLVDGEADLAAMELIMTTDRLEAIQFTTPVYSTKCRTYIKRPESRAVKWNAYLAPFGKYIWNALAILIIIATGAIAVIERSVKKIAELPEHDTIVPTRVTETLFYVFGVFCSQGMEPSILDPIRMVHLSVHLTAVIVLAAYSAALISFLAVKTFIMPFTTMEGLLNDGTYRFAVVANSADYTFFQNTTDKVLSVMFDELLARETDLPLNYIDGMSRICKEEKYAFMTIDNMAEVLQDKVECTLEALDVMMQITVAMAVPNRSPYKGIMDANILLLRDSGILQRLLHSEWTTNKNKPKSNWTSVELEDILPLILFLLIALLITCLVLLMERAAFQRVQELHRRRMDVITIVQNI